MNTPGPWKILETEGCETDSLYSVWPANGFSAELGDESIHEICCLDEYPEAKANVRLIAAAPDLLEALEAVFDWYESGGDLGGRILREMVESAIHKAKGDS